MRSRRRVLALGMAGLVTVGASAGGAIAAREQRPRSALDRGASEGPLHAAARQVLSRAELIVEINETDGDAGLQVSLDGDAWRSVTIHRPDGSEILQYGTWSDVRRFGMTELFSESSEPPFTRFPLDEFRALFPEGEYRLVGRSVKGVRTVTTATLSHAFPAAPEIVRPHDGATVSSDGLTIRWKPTDQPAGVDVVGYEVTFEREDPLRIFSADLPADARRIRIPAVYLEPGVEYSAEVLAIDASGNRTLASSTLTAE
jgi:hypothetical protein